MKKVLNWAIVVTSVGIMQFAHATSICDVKVALKDARENLVAMVASTEKATQEDLKKQVDEATTALETAVEALLSDDSTAADNQSKLNLLKETWAAFKETRETQIVPAIYAGKNDEAKAIATGIQAERMTTMNGLIKDLGGDDCEPPKE